MPFNELAGLAAAHAALDPARHNWRSDILISSVIEVLASQGPMSERSLHERIKKLWVTNAVNAAMLRNALHSAEKEDLVERRLRRNDTRWAATATSADDAETDQAWVRELLKQLEEDVAQRLPQLLEDSEKPDTTRIRNLTGDLVDALIAGSERVLRGVVRANDPESLSAIEFDHAAAAELLRERIHPEQMAQKLIALVTAAADQRNPFGTDILLLIVRGQVLHGMLTYRDVKRPIPVQESLLLLDTSVLADRLEYGPSPRILEEFLRLSTDAQCDVVVTRAVLDEWDVLWRKACEEFQDLGDASTDLPPPVLRYAQSLVLRSWRSWAEDGQPQTLVDFERHNRNIENWLTKRGVRVIEHDAPEAPDSAHVEQIRAELTRLSDTAWKHDPGAKPKRTPAAALTDAYSIAFIANMRERRLLPVPRAWFIAKDQLSDRAYRAIQTTDPFPVVCAVEAWLLLLSAGSGSDPGLARDLTEIVARSAIRDSFLAVSANFELEQLKDMIKLLYRDPGVTAEDVAEALRPDSVALAAMTHTDVARGVARRRLQHSENRLHHREEQFRDTVVTQRARDARDTDEKRRLAGRAKALEEDNNRLRHRLGRLRRTAWLMGTVVIIVAGLLATALVGVPSWMEALGATGGVAFVLDGVRWATKPSVKNFEFICAFGLMLAWSVFSSILGAGLTQPTPAHSVHKTPPRVVPAAAKASQELGDHALSNQKQQLY